MYDIVDRFGIFGMFVIAVSFFILLIGWVMAVMVFIWPILLPFFILAWMAYVTKRDEEQDIRRRDRWENWRKIYDV